jgi:hypothetical protein
MHYLFWLLLKLQPSSTSPDFPSTSVTDAVMATIAVRHLLPLPLPAHPPPHTLHSCTTRCHRRTRHNCDSKPRRGQASPLPTSTVHASLLISATFKCAQLSRRFLPRPPPPDRQHTPPPLLIGVDGFGVRVGCRGVPRGQRAQLHVRRRLLGA